jgi:uncharacterized membrane protein
MKLERNDIAAALVVGVEAATAALVYWRGKLGPLPLHFGLSGQVDRWGDRHEVAFWLAGIAAVTGLAYLLLPALAIGRNGSRIARTMPGARLALLVPSIVVTLFMVSMGLGLISGDNRTEALRAVMALSALVFVGVGALLGKAEPSPLVGVRTYWSLRSRLAWDKSNRLCGRLMFWLGLTGLALSPIAPQPLGFQGFIAALLAIAAISVFESWRVWRDDPNRLGAGQTLV